MNKDKMVKEAKCHKCIHFPICSWWTTTDLIADEGYRYDCAHYANEKGYRKVEDDEIVIKKDEYMDFLRTRLNELKKHSEFIDGFSQGYEQAKQEIVKKILQELSDEGYKIYEQQGYTFDIGNFYWLIAYAKRKYEINLE